MVSQVEQKHFYHATNIQTTETFKQNQEYRHKNKNGLFIMTIWQLG